MQENQGKGTSEGGKGKGEKEIRLIQFYCPTVTVYHSSFLRTREGADCPKKE